MDNMLKFVLYRVTPMSMSSDAYFFFTKSIPYAYKGNRVPIKYELLSYNVECIVYTLGGGYELFKGLFKDIPIRYIGFLTEVRIMDTSKIMRV
jgi:hypothetical protein